MDFIETASTIVPVFLNIFLTVLMLGVIILVHEAGHFFAARFFKVPVTEFAIGMGPLLYKKHGKETQYSVRAIPIGGYVNIEGMDPDDHNEHGFNKKPAYQRFIILFAGVFMNFVLAFIIVFVIVISQGKMTIKDTNVIGALTENTMAYENLLVGDKILSIDNLKVNTWDEIRDNLKDKTEFVNIEIERAGELVEKKIEMTYFKDVNRYILGVAPEMEIVKYNLISGFVKTNQEYIRLFELNFKGLAMMVQKIYKGELKSNEVAGPVGLVGVIGTVSKGGFISLIYFTAIISISIGIFNLLPFPALDGGRIIFVVLEMFKIKVNKKIEERVHKFGLIFLLGIMLLITYNDILNIVKNVLKR